MLIDEVKLANHTIHINKKNSHPVHLNYLNLQIVMLLCTARVYCDTGDLICELPVRSQFGCRYEQVANKFNWFNGESVEKPLSMFELPSFKEIPFTPCLEFMSKYEWRVQSVLNRVYKQTFLDLSNRVTQTVSFRNGWRNCQGKDRWMKEELEELII